MVIQKLKKFLKDAKAHNKNSVLYKHHINYINDRAKYYTNEDYDENEANEKVVDYIASMTDDYFVDLYKYLFPKGKHHVKYIGYFE